jgi:hypothetical protein
MLLGRPFAGAHPPEDKAGSILQEMLDTNQNNLPPRQMADQKGQQIDKYMHHTRKRITLFVDRHPLILQDKITNQMRDKRIHVFLP